MVPVNVTLSRRAHAFCVRHRIPEPAIKRARAGSSSSEYRPDFLVVTADLEDGRRIRMRCCHDQPGQIASLAVV